MLEIVKSPGSSEEIAPSSRPPSNLQRSSNAILMAVYAFIAWITLSSQRQEIVGALAAMAGFGIGLWMSPKIVCTITCICAGVVYLALSLVLFSPRALPDTVHARLLEYAALFFLFSAVALVICFMTQLALKDSAFPPRTLNWSMTLAAAFALLAGSFMFRLRTSLFDLIATCIIAAPVVLQALLLWKMPVAQPIKAASSEALFESGAGKDTHA